MSSFTIDKHGIHGNGFSLTHEEAQKETVTARLEFGAGLGNRRSVPNKIRKFLDTQGIDYEIKEYKSFLWTDFLLIIRGTLSEVAPVAQAVENWLSRIATRD